MLQEFVEQYPSTFEALKPEWLALYTRPFWQVIEAQPITSHSLMAPLLSVPNQGMPPFRKLPGVVLEYVWTPSDTCHASSCTGSGPGDTPGGYGIFGGSGAEKVSETDTRLAVDSPGEPWKNVKGLPV